MSKFSKKFKIISLVLVFISLLFVGVISAIGGTQEAYKIIDYKDKLGEQGISANYLNSIQDIIVDTANNEYVDVINKYKGDVNINTENTYFTQKDYKNEAIALNNVIPNNSITFIHNNGEPLDAKDEVTIGIDYYAGNELAPKNPTSIVPIHKPCDRTVEADKSITYSNCETFITTDNQPLFISYFENGNEYQGGGFTIVEIRNKSDDSLVKRFFMGGSKMGDMSMDYVLHKSYTYGVVQTQDRSNLFIPGASGNLNLDGITTTSYDTLNQGEYAIYFQNINKFGLKSDKVKAGYLAIVPPEGALQDFDFITITDLNTSIQKNIVGGYVAINYKKDARVTINNPGNYDYDILSIIPGITKSGNEFTIDELQEGDNIFNVQIKDQAGNVLDNKPLVITVDTMPPVIRAISLDHSFMNQPTTDGAIAMIKYLGRDHVNDNIDFSGVNGGFKTPFALSVSDNVSLSGVTTQYSLSASGSYNNVIDFAGTDGAYTFNVDTSFISPDGEITLYFRAIDQFGNISLPKPVVFIINRHANTPRIITNEGNDIITNNTSIDLRLELDEDIVKVLYEGMNLTDYQPFSTTYTPTIPLQLGEKNYIFNAIDMLGNRSLDSSLSILKNPTPKEGIYGQDKTIQFEGGVTTNKINLQRVTGDGTAGEVFSR